MARASGTRGAATAADKAFDDMVAGKVVEMIGMQLTSACEETKAAADSLPDGPDHALAVRMQKGIAAALVMAKAVLDRSQNGKEERVPICNAYDDGANDLGITSRIGWMDMQADTQKQEVEQYLQKCKKWATSWAKDVIADRV